MANQSAADLFRRPMGFQLFYDELAQLWVTSELAQPCSAVFADVVGNNAMIAIIVWYLRVPKAVALDLAIDRRAMMTHELRNIAEREFKLFQLK